ncbi:MAG TPA: methyl-accepting chemotaxis protein [Candidatus Xenobia bacterium]|jgi:methyl-accepting chemotaxis protein WspA
MRRLSIISLIFLVVFGALSIFILVFGRGRVHEDMQHMLQARQLKEYANDCMLNVLTMHSVALASLLSPERLGDLAEEKTHAFDDNQKKYQQMKSLTSVKATLDLIDQLTRLQEERITPVDTSVLEKLMTNPAEAKAAYYKEYDPLISQFKQLSQQLMDHAQEEATEAQSSLEAGISLVSGPVLLGICMGLVLPTLGLLTVRMARRLDTTVDVLEQAAAGDLSQRLDGSGSDEVSRMCLAFNHTFDITSRAIKSMQDSGIVITGAATKLSATVKEQEVRATEQTASTVEVSMTAQRIAGTNRTLVHTVEEVTGIARQTSSLAASGRERLQQMETTTRDIISAAAPIVSQLAVLSEKAGSITTVVTTINKVADQTNLLSLNAAIEAEKAGEAGRGFGVVASEIRRLADQTAVSTLDIESIVREVQASVSQGVMRMDKFTEDLRRATEDVRQTGSSLSVIIEQVQDLSNRFEDVDSAVRMQFQAAEQISQAMSELRTVSEHNTAAVAESNAVAQMLKDAADTLHHEVSQFKVHA